MSRTLLQFLFGFCVGILFLAKATASVTSKKQPSVVILCNEGGVYRSLDLSEGFIASGGGGCILADIHGGRTTADAITCYDAGKAAP